jgi:lipid-binding SYLF domain-containing protein
MRKNILSIVLVTVMLGLGSLTFPAQSGSEAADERIRVLKAAEVFRDMLTLPEKGIPPALLRKTQAIAIIPGYVKAAYVVGGEHGKGVIAVRRDDGSWSVPAFVEMTGGSLGLQIGFEKADFILVFKDRASVATIDQGKFTLGGSASVAAGPVGRSARASTDIKFEAEVYSYSRSKGIFAGISLNGAAFSMDKKANERFYQKPGITVDDVLYKEPGPPKEAVELKELLDKNAK